MIKNCIKCTLYKLFGIWYWAQSVAMYQSTNGSKEAYTVHTQGNLFEILSSQTEIRLYSPFSDWLEPNGRPFGYNQSKNGKYNLISVWLDKISKRFLCVYKYKGRNRQILEHFVIWYIAYHEHFGLNIKFQITYS